MSEKDLDQEHPYDYIPEGHLLDATPKKEDARLFWLCNDIFLGWEESKLLKNRWRKVIGKLTERGIKMAEGIPGARVSWYVMTREQILSMNTWNKIEKYLDKAVRVAKENKYIQINGGDGALKLMEGFEDYFLEEWLES